MQKSRESILDKMIDAARWLILGVPVALSFATAAPAETGYVVTETVEYEYSDLDEQPLRLPDTPANAQYGPFRLVAPDRVELIDAVSSDTPAQFRALIAAHPDVHQIDMVDCPGSVDDDANLALARMIRERGLATHIPAGGSIRSGGVELFLAGVTRTAAKDAEIGVHSWEDSDGLQATDFAADDPVHTPYLAFYRDMGFAPDKARAFYDFTNSAAPFDELHVMTPREIGAFGLLTG